MRVGWQEIIALTIVALVLVWALYRRWKKSRPGDSGQPSPEKQDESTTEAPLNFYRRRR